MSMAARAFLFGVLIMIVGCKADGLSDKECRLIKERELAFMRTLLKFDQASKMDEPDRAFDKCIAGELYSREDYECIAAAESNSAMGQCMANAHEKAP